MHCFSTIQSSPKKSALLCLFLWGGLFPFSAWTHPHAIIETTISFIFDEEGLIAIKSLWRYDNNVSMDLFSIHDKNEDGQLDDTEITPMIEEITGRLQESHYFSQLRIDGQPYPITSITNAGAYEKDQRIFLEIAIPCKIPAGEQTTEIRISQYDPSYYTAFQFAEPAFQVIHAGSLKFHVDRRKNMEESYYGGIVHPEELLLRFGRNDTLTSDGPKTPQKDTQNNTPTALAYPRSVAEAFAWIVAKQQALQQQLEALIKTPDGKAPRPTALAILGLMAFLYGALHAIGPGHGKFILSSYLIGNRSAAAYGVLLGSLLALCHGASGAAIVLIGRFLFARTADAIMGSVETPLKIMSFAIIALMGAFLIFMELTGRGHSHAPSEPDDFNPSPPSPKTLRKGILLALAAGIVPCPGVIIVVLFCAGADHIALGIFLAACITAGMAASLSLVTVVAASATAILFKNVFAEKHWIHTAERIFRIAGASLLLTAGALFILFELL